MDTATTKPETNVDTWQEIESLVEELSELARAQTSASRFYPQLLDRAVSATGGTAGAIWSVAQNEIELQYQVHLEKTCLLADDQAASVHRGLLQQVLDEQKGGVFPPRPAAVDEGQPANPTEFSVAMCPIDVEGRTVAIIEVFQPAACSPAAQRGCLQLLVVLAELSADFHRNWLLRQLRDRESVWNQFEQFVERVHASTAVDETAYAVVNEARSLIQCDRVSIALRKGRRCRLLAASGLDMVDRRTTTARCLQDMAAQVVRSSQPLWYSADQTDESGEMSPSQTMYINASKVHEFAILPLRRPDDDGPDGKRKRPLGALIVERYKPDDQALARHRIASVTRHATSALGNALDVRDLPLMPLVRTFARLRWQVRLRRLPITILILLILAGLVTALIVVPADFDVEGRGELQPVVRRNLYAPLDGDVHELVFERRKIGDVEVLAVTKEDPVVILKNPKLEYEILRVAGELRTAASELQTLKVTMAAASRRGTVEDRNRKEELSARFKELEAKITSLQKLAEKLREQEALLTINSPIDGEVLTWNVIEQLRLRPVLRGQKLMEVAATQGEWILELRVPEHDIGHILDAQSDLKQDLDVRFILKTDPGIEYEGTVIKVARAVETDPVAGSTVMVTIRFDADKLPMPRPGTQVIGKIRCGRRPLGYVWLHDLWDSVRQQLAF